MKQQSKYIIVLKSDSSRKKYLLSGVIITDSNSIKERVSEGYQKSSESTLYKGLISIPRSLFLESDVYEIIWTVNGEEEVLLSYQEKLALLKKGGAGDRPIKI